MTALRSPLILSLLFLITPVLSLLAQDSTPPVLEGFRVSPSVVDVTDGPVDVQLEFDIRDDISGFDYVRIDLVFDATRYIIGMTSANIIEGTVLNGTYRTSIPIPRGSPPGERTFRLIVYDDVDNLRIYEPDTTFQVVTSGPYDREKPTINNITIEPRIVDLSEGPATVHISIDVSDDFSGIDELWTDVKPKNPEAALLWFSNRRFFDITEGSETATVEFTARFGEFTEAGEWYLLIDNFSDRALRASGYNGDPGKLEEDFDSTFTIVNPNGDGTPPDLISLEFDETVANTAFETTFLPWRVRFTDDIAGIRYASIYVYSPGQSSQYLFSSADYDDIDSINRNDGVLEGVLEVPRFVLEGEHRIQVALEDRAGNRTRYGHNSDNPLPAGSPEFITVAESAGADVTDVIITDVKVTPNSVDITNGPQTVAMEISFEDDRSGLQFLSFSVKDINDDTIARIDLTTEDLISGSAVNGTVRATFEIPQFSVPGEYRFTGLRLRDQADNNFSDFIFPIFPAGMPAGIDVINNGPVETEPPEILSVNMPQTEFTINGQSLDVPITVMAQDDLTGVDEVRIIYEHPDDSADDLIFIMRAPRDVISQSGKVLTFEDTGILGKYNRPGTYVLDQVRIKDVFGLQRDYDTADPDSLPSGLPSEITVINNGPVDTEPPTIDDVRLSATSFNVTHGPGTLEVEIDFNDGVSGLYSVDITMRHTDEFYLIWLLDEWFRDGNLNLISGDLNQGTLRQLLTIPQYIPEGEYSLRIELSDGAFRDSRVNPIPDDGVITVANSGPVDRTDPQLVNLEFEAMPDVTDGPASFPVIADVIDDLAGISYFYIAVRSPSEKEFTNFVERPQPFDYPSLTDIQFPVTLEIPAFAEPGEWTLEVTLRDANGGRVSYDPIDIERLGLPSTFTVINNRPPGYLWKGSDSTTTDGWREVDWFGWVQDQGDYPFVYHLEHGWIYTSGSDLEQFAFYDLTLGIWWWISEANYPWMYASAGPGKSGWAYYYAPFGTPGNRWFYDPASGQNIQETGLFAD